MREGRTYLDHLFLSEIALLCLLDGMGELRKRRRGPSEAAHLRSSTHIVG